MKKTTLWGFTVFLFVASSAYGKHPLLTSGAYLKYCQESIKVYEDKHADKLAAAECLGFVEGAIGMHAALNAFGQSTPFYCMPEHGVDSFDATTTWVKYLEKNPQKLDKQPVLSFLLAMKESFPCPQN